MRYFTDFEGEVVQTVDLEDRSGGSDQDFRERTYHGIDGDLEI